MSKKTEYQKELAFLEAIGVNDVVIQYVKESFDRFQKELGENFNIEDFKLKMKTQNILNVIAKAIKGFFDDEILVKLTEELKKGNTEMIIPDAGLLIQLINNALHNYYSGKPSDENIN